MADDNYHIGLCECTDTGNLQVTLNMAGVTYYGYPSDYLYHPCQNGVAAFPKCLPKAELNWFVGIADRFQGRVSVIGPGSYCNGVAYYKCVFGTCFPTGGYVASSLVDTGSVNGHSEKRTFDGASNPAIKCCGFHKESNI